MRNRAFLAAVLGGLTATATACTERAFQPGFEDDTFGPAVSIIKTAGDTLSLSDGIKFGVAAADNLGLRTLSVALSGGFQGVIDTVFTGAVTQVALAVEIPLPANTTAGGWIYLEATALDGNNNAAVALDSVYLLNQSALTVTIVRPSVGALTSPGRQIIVELRAYHQEGVESIGYTLSGVLTGDTTQGFTSPLPDSVRFVDTLTVPNNTNTGTFDVTGYASDSTGRRALSAPVTVTVQSISNDTDPPIVKVKVNKRVEVDDSLTVNATDPSGIQKIGWTARLLNGTLVGGDSLTLSGTLTDVTETWEVGFSFATLPQSIVVEGFAEDAAGNRGTSNTPTPAPSQVSAAAMALDTITVVNGITRPLPAGGRVVDAIYSRNLNEVYLTNIAMGRLEVFQVANTTFVAGGIPVGAQPHGIALWPSDASGNSADTVVVANSGGTDLSVVDLQLRREVRRHALPNFVVDEVSTELDQQTGIIQIKFTRHDFSDRPQYLGMTCRPGVGVCNPGEIIAVYSTTPTIDQDLLPLRGSVRWENLTSATPESHFFWEHAEVPPAPDFDTLRVFVDRGPFAPFDTVLATACGRMVNMDQLVFRETTFVRNSGDFSHALVGEGGVIEGEDFAQAVGFDARQGILSGTCSGSIAVAGTTLVFTGPIEEDLGITSSFRVSDFISNTATVVNSIAINFNGLTNLVRTTDSIYVLNEFLRLKGLVPVGGVNPGMDLNFDHAFEAGVGGTAGTFGGSLDPDDRLVFAASEDPMIEVFDTFFFDRVTRVPIRDPIIGPLRVARLPSGEQILIGVTAAGVVTVRLPAISNIFPIQAIGPP